MKSLRFLDRRAGYSLASLGLLLGMVVPSVLPAFASAAQLSSRSIALSSSAAGASGVSQTITFTPSVGDGTSTYYAVLIYCDDSPIVGQACDTTNIPSTSSVTLGAGSTDGSAAISGTPGANNVVVSTKLTASSPTTIVLDGFTNPASPTSTSANNGYYARIQTYATSGAATTAAATASSPGSPLDDGGIAMSITNAVGVTATVRETMTFCVAGNVDAAVLAAGPSGNCGVDNKDGTTGATGLDTSHISLTLGHGTPAALDSSVADTASDWAQISTNATAGAIVSMKNTNDGNCNGLFRIGGTSGTCDIAGAGDTAVAIAGGNALFGMLLGTTTRAPNSVATPTGTITPVTRYDGTSGNYGMGANVTSTYGDPIFNTGGIPISNKNVKFTFAASAAPTTPAGIYQATMNLIATGTF